MRTLLMLVGVVGCKSPLPSERVDTLVLPGCTIAVPAGWNVTRAISPPGGHTLIPDHAVDGFAPSIVIQELTMSASDHELVVDATDGFCRDSILTPLTAQTGTDPGFARAITIGSFHGCDIELRDKQTAQAGRQISLSNGKLGVSFVCNRDKHPPAGVDVDGACETLARAIKPA